MLVPIPTVPNSSSPPLRNASGSSEWVPQGFYSLFIHLPISIPSSSTFPNKETVADELDSGRHVVFGEVVSGMDVMKSVEKVGRKEDGKVSDSKKVTVKDCGPV